MRLIDTHAHLDQIEDYPSEISRARDSGIQAILAVSGDMISGKKTLQITHEYRGYVYPALGYHPWELGKNNVDVKDTLSFIQENIEHCTAVGEIGLDYSYPGVKEGPERMRVQLEVYCGLLKLAKEHELPCCVHSRGAYKDAYESALQYGPDRVVFHWYDGPVKLVKKIVDAGFFVSCTPAVEYSSGVRNALSEVPLEQLMLETDAPVFSRKLNRNLMPTDVTLSNNYLAELKGVDPETLGEITTGNAIRFFSLD